LNAISLFSGAGGLDYGFEAAGFQTRAALEMDKDCCQILRHNRSFAVIEADIHDVSAVQLLDAAGLSSGDIDFLFGGPPCQPFSKSGFWSNGSTKRLNDPRAKTLIEYMRLVEEIKPKVLLLENVAGISFKGKSEGQEYLIKQLSRINKDRGTNYQPVFKTINMAEYGVPQIRSRFFMVATIDGRLFSFPEPTHKDPSERADDIFRIDKPRFRTAWDAIGDLSIPEDSESLRMRGQWADLLPSIPEGYNYLWHTNRNEGMPLFGWRTRYWSFLLKLAKDKPSWTIQAQPGPAIGPFHWSNRRLSMREMARLMTFPDDVEIQGSLGSIQKQLGNAVPSLMAEILGREILRQFFGKRIRRQLKLEVPDRGIPPKAESVLPVPEKYHHHAGEHEDHPGTGKGRGALARKGD
jgi:DNA (cytosine-5)-methyltransferase 1